MVPAEDCDVRLAKNNWLAANSEHWDVSEQYLRAHSAQAPSSWVLGANDSAL